MKALLLLWLTALPLLAQDIDCPVFVAETEAVAGGGASFTDDFNRATLGANWTKITQGFGAIEIDGSTVVKSENSFDTGTRGAAYTATSLNANHYVKVTLTAANGTAPSAGVLLRYVDASSPCYGVGVRQDSDLVRWYYLSTPSAVISDIQTSTSFAFTYPVTLGVTITGTGNSTIVRIWKDPTANAPTSASSWDGGAATVEFTDDPSSAADAGTKAGLAGSGNADIYWDNIFAGDIP